MSETIGNPLGRAGLNPPAAATAFSAASSARAASGGPSDAAHEAYSFACLSCGYCWEQEYVIEHRTDRDGHVTVQYQANGVRVPSPLLQPACPGCGASTVRIMGAGRVAAADRFWGRVPGAPGPGPRSAVHPARETSGTAREPRRRHGRGLHLPFHIHIRLRRHRGTPEA